MDFTKTKLVIVNNIIYFRESHEPIINVFFRILDVTSKRDGLDRSELILPAL